MSGLGMLSPGSFLSPGGYLPPSGHTLRLSGIRSRGCGSTGTVAVSLCHSERRPFGGQSRPARCPHRVPVSVSGSDQRAPACVGGLRVGGTRHAIRPPRTAHEHATARRYAARDPPAATRPSCPAPNPNPSMAIDELDWVPRFLYRPPRAAPLPGLGARTGFPTLSRLRAHRVFERDEYPCDCRLEPGQGGRGAAVCPLRIHKGGSVLRQVT